MKHLFKRLVARILAAQVRRLRAKRDFKVVAVAGSIGKTSSKFAIAQVLSSKYRVRFQEGNYNVDVAVPLVFFGLSLPSISNPFAWLVTFLKIERQLLRPYPYDVVVIELGTDGPGQIAAFGSFIHADVGVLTAIAPEHMEFFDDLDGVAREELAIGGLSDTLLINKDLIAPQYLPSGHPKLVTYGKDSNADYQLRDISLQPAGYTFSIAKHDTVIISASHHSISLAQLYSLLAAATVGDCLGMATEEILQGFERVTAVPGRMQLLKGINGSTLIDDTYNASGEAMKAALTTLYDMPASQRIALLGNMNELGGYSIAAHTEVGAFCDPDKLTEVITLGPDANEHLAAAAEKRGCKVTRCDSPYQAGEYIKSILQPGATVLLKGSQNKVFAEEALKSLLADSGDAAKLVRQSKHWLDIKQKQFKP